MKSPSGPSPASAAARRLRPGDTVMNPLGYGRETVESIVIAFTLALLFRAFEAEAFVIPTGSMAPTLMGRHKDLVCESCGRDFRVGCSAEEDDQSQSLRAEAARLERELAALKAAGDQGRTLQEQDARRRRIELLESDHGPIGQLRTRLAGKLVPAARCPNCGHGMRLVQGAGGESRYDPRYPSFSGDRILVDKFAYDLGAPNRWDVVVFKYPEEAKTNYIKRLVGLPGETISIVNGDIWTARGDAEPQIARKPPAVMRAMLQCVHDSRYVSPELRRAGWPLDWSDWSAAEKEPTARWASADEGRSYRIAAGRGQAAPATLRFRHAVPSAEDWERVRQGESLADRARPAPVDDFQPYNAIATRPHWVGDLALEMECEVVDAGEGRLTIDLVEAGLAHTCTFDLATGEAVVKPASAPEGETPPRARTPVRGRGSWKILFANVDDELSLFVDGRRMTFDGTTAWTRSIGDAAQGRPSLAAAEPGGGEPSDLAPVGITVTAADVRVSDLRVLRDTYYIGATDVGARPGEILEEDWLEFGLEEDQFFVLGDNSAASKDSRLWLEGHHVDRDLLIGKAIAIFWPHAVPARWSVPVKIGGVELRLPSWPNFARMRFVR